MSEKSILEQALLQVQTLEEAVKSNAKGILASTMKQELNDLLKESLEEEEKVDEQPNPEEEETDDMSDADADSPEGNEAEPENVDDLDNEDPDKGIDSMDSDDMSDDSSDDVDSSDDMSDEMGGGDMDSDQMGSDDDVMDMSGASDEEVLKVFKAMKPEDGIVVKKDGDQLDVDLGDDEYIIKLDDEMDSDSDMSDEVTEGGWEEGDVNEADSPDTLYEIELDEDETSEEETTESSKEDEESKEVEATEAARTKSNPHGNKGGQNRAGIPSKKTYKAGSSVTSINEEVSKLRKQNDEYKKALVLFKEKLNEVAVFNASLAYATRLFTEHSTTKQEKLNILKRFDSVSTMNESKSLFNTIKSELGTKKTVTESVVEKISNTPSTSSSQQVLSESKAYENPQFKRMKDLMSKLK